MAYNGYKSMKSQMEANKRYLENNPEAKKRKNKSLVKSSCKRYILMLATDEEIKTVEEWIKIRKNKKSS